MKTLRLLFGILLMTAAFLASSSLSFATPEITKKEKKPCTTCHVTAKSKDLNNVGKYYKEHKSLEGAPAPTPAPAK
jgi:hypothetical protein